MPARPLEAHVRQQQGAAVIDDGAREDQRPDDRADRRRGCLVIDDDERRQRRIGGTGRREFQPETLAQDAELVELVRGNGDFRARLGNGVDETNLLDQGK